MYSNYYHLSNAPFALVPNKHQLYISEQQLQVFDYLNNCLDDDGISALVGAKGVGKSLLLHLFVRQLESNKTAILIENPNLSISELYQQIAQTFNLKYYGQPHDLKIIVNDVKSELIKQQTLKSDIVLIIDDVHLMSDALLHELRFLDNLDKNGHKLIKLIIAGETVLYEKLKQPQFASLRQRLTTFYTIPILDNQHSRDYLEQQLFYVDGSLDLFTPSAIKLIIQKSKGRPHWLNLLADASLKQNFIEQQHAVNGFEDGDDENTDTDYEQYDYGHKLDSFVKVDEPQVKSALKKLYFWQNDLLFKTNNRTVEPKQKVVKKKENKNEGHVTVGKLISYLAIATVTVVLFVLLLIWSFVHYNQWYQPYKNNLLVKQLFQYIPLTRESDAKAKDQPVLITKQAETVIQLSAPKDNAKKDIETKVLHLNVVNNRSAAVASVSKTDISDAKASKIEVSEAVASKNISTPVISSATAAVSNVSTAISMPVTTNEQHTIVKEGMKTNKVIEPNKVITDETVANNIVSESDVTSMDYTSQPKQKAYNIALFSIVAKDIVDDPVEKMIDNLFSEGTEALTEQIKQMSVGSSKMSSIKKGKVSSAPSTAIKPKDVDPIESVIDSVLNTNNVIDDSLMTSTNKTSSAVSAVSDAASSATNTIVSVPKTIVPKMLQNSPIISLDKLSPFIRKDLPNLYFQSHIFTPNVMYNWIKVNDKVVKEGEMITNNIQLIRIDPESTVIYFEEKMIRIPALATVHALTQ